jgi:magnesium transporter
MSEENSSKQEKNWRDAFQLLEKNRLALDVLHNQNMRHHDLVETLVRKQNLAKLDKMLEEMDAIGIARLLEAVPSEDQLFVWARLRDTQKELALREIPLSVLQVLGKSDYRSERFSIKAFDLVEGRLREITINTRDDLAEARPIWVDLVAPTFEERIWIGDVFGIDLPDPDKLNDLESSARFYMEESGEVNLRSDFLLDKDGVSYNVAVAFILHNDILFSVRNEELPVFRLQRRRALSQPFYVSGAKDVLLDLYAADVEYSADALEDVYLHLERVGNHVLSKQLTDEEAATMLSSIAHEEDMNGRIRRNVLDTRRAVSFLIRSRLLSKEQLDDAHQIFLDIESLDGHTSFLFDKINFLMDATVGFININQNRTIKQLTVLSVVIMPLNVVAGIFGMSEYTEMTKTIPMAISYTVFAAGMVTVAWMTYRVLKIYEKRRLSQRPTGVRREGQA